ncbi:unnamed protein product [Phytophthora fragariaefolia]|uniref:Unnamed protein product n=1 Tax=Phytophthora fragariaefolia TaxID=1490495 RepID=A0A9W6X1A8_9STRA|nr:unnamed protein product [Phytophthora fragariaefolia]
MLRVLRVPILDYKLNYRDWTRLIPIVQASLYHSAVPVLPLAGKIPGELFTGLEPPSSLQADKACYLPRGLAVTAAQAHNVFRVKHLVTGEELDAHASRFNFFADKGIEVTEELLEHVAAQGIMTRVLELLQHRWNDRSQSYEILVEWHGLEAIEGSW